MQFKKVFALAILAASVISTVNAYAADNAADGGLVVTGSLVAQSCMVPTAELTKTVDFDTVDIKDITGLGVDAVVPSTTKPLTFDVTGCPGAAGQSVQVRFDYQQQSGVSNGYLNNTGDAKGVLIGVNKKGDPAKIAPAGTISADTDADGAATIEAEANLYKASSLIYTGNVNSTMNVTLVNP